MSFKAGGHKSRPNPVRPLTSATTDLRESRPAHSRSSSPASSTASFHSARYSPEEEERLLASSNELKLAANEQFARQDYSSALSTYDKAIAECPSYLDYELAVLSSNIAACHLRLEEWKDALQAADRGMESLESLLPMPKSSSQERDDSKPNDSEPVPKDRRESQDGDNPPRMVELPEDNTEADNERVLRDLNITDQRMVDIHRIRTKLLLRRAKARYMLGTTSPKALETGKSTSPNSSFSPSSAWSNLSSAQSDYQILSTPPYFKTLPAADRRTVQTALVTLRPLIEQAKDKEVKEMMSKLKDLGNGILRPFGLSTDMFSMEKDERSGGMSLKFDGAAKR